jgi:hypothetical protein
MRRIWYWSMVFFFCLGARAQVLSVIEDFEGWPANPQVEDWAAFQTTGPLKWEVVQADKNDLSMRGGLQDQYLKVQMTGAEPIRLSFLSEIPRWWDIQQDVLRFFILSSDLPLSMRLVLDGYPSVAEIDQSSLLFSLSHTFLLPISAGWQEVSLPLAAFLKSPAAYKFNGDEPLRFFVTLELSGLENQVFAINDVEMYRPSWSPHIQTQPRIWGVWDEAGKEGHYPQIPEKIEGYLPDILRSRFKIIHVFFSLQEQLPEDHGWLDSLQKLTQKGYIPLLTLELPTWVWKIDPFPLFSLETGQFDSFLTYLGGKLKTLNAPVWIRPLHEFNGDWYPWSLSYNGKSPDIYVSCYRRIVKILTNAGGNQLKFVWCPNAIDLPAVAWNVSWKAYPGDDVVDFLGVDVYNGTQSEAQIPWKSFRNLALDVAGKLSRVAPEKPLVICEVGTRSRFTGEFGKPEDKLVWIEAMGHALAHEMPQSYALVWFNEGNFSWHFPQNSAHVLSKSLMYWIQFPKK